MEMEREMKGPNVFCHVWEWGLKKMASSYMLRTSCIVCYLNMDIFALFGWGEQLLQLIVSILPHKALVFGDYIAFSFFIPVQI